MFSLEGIKLARNVGAEQMSGKNYTHVLTSTFFRTMQTACAFAEGAGDFTVARFDTSEALNSEEMKEWGAYIKLHGARLVQSEDLIVEESGRMADGFQALCSRLPENARMLAVGHAPLLECLVFGLTGAVIDPLHECEGVILDYDGSKFVLVEEIRL